MSPYIMKDGDPMPEKARFIVCKASAGSGKTFQLVTVYLTLAFSIGNAIDKRKALKERFKRILAITFTNKAVNEMKDRILKELSAMSDDTAETRPLMETKLMETTGLARDEIRWRAKEVYAAILHSYSDLAVCTIDSFVNRIVKTFAHDLSLPANFDISLDDKELKDKVTDSLMALVGTAGEEELTSLLYEYCNERMADNKSYNLEESIKNMIPKVLEEDAPRLIDLLGKWNLDKYKELRKKYISDNAAFESAVGEKARAALKIIEDSGIDHKMFYQGERSAPNYFKKIANKDFGNVSSYARQFFDGDKCAKPKCDKAIEDAIMEIKPQLTALYLEIEDIKKQGLKMYNSRKMLLSRLYEMGLMRRLYSLVEEYYNENDTLHISELNKKIAQIVTSEEDSLFIYERIGNIYQNILIDEFQDTSKLQWQNLVPLIENSVALGHTSLVVGDSKQAIYRFRQGDVRQFVRLPEVEGYKYLNIGHPEIYSPYPKSDNWRSRPNIVTFNNEFFSYAIRNSYSENENLTNIYLGEQTNGEDALTQHCKVNPEKKHGTVKMSFYSKNEEMWEPIVEEIELQHSKGYDYGEICVLSKERKHLNEIAALLTQKGIKIESSESQKLTNSHLVRLILATMRCVVNPQNRQSTLTAMIELEYLGLIGKSSTELLLQQNKNLTLDEILRTTGISIDFDELIHLSLYDCCEALVRTYNTDGHENNYVTKLLNVIADYTQHHRQDLQEFLEWTDDHLEKLSLTTTPTNNAIPLMTIHTAKGLQWPVVIVALPKESNHIETLWVDVDKESMELPVGLVSLTKDSNSIFDKQFSDEQKLIEMDRMNLLYVALTRPEEKLIIHAFAKPSSDGSKLHGELLSLFAKETGNKDEGVNFTVAETVCGLLYTFGDDYDKEPAEKMANLSGLHKIAEETIGHIAYPDYGGRINYALHANDEHISEEREFGTMVHEILSSIDNADDIEPAVKRYAKRNHISDDVLPVVCKMLDYTVNGDASRRFFANGLKVRKETPLLFGGKELRPDRIVFADGETWVVDFKTGAEHESYKSQVREYCAAIAAMGYPSVKGYLMYLNETGCEVVEV